MTNLISKKLKILILAAIIFIIIGLVVYKIKVPFIFKKSPEVILFSPEKKPPHFPDNIELFGFKKITQNYEVENDGKIQSVRQFISVFPVDNLYNQYKLYFQIRGYKIFEDQNNNDIKKVLHLNKNNESASIYIEKVYEDKEGNNYNSLVTIYYFIPIEK